MGIVSGAGNAVAISVDIVVAVAQDDAAACSSSAIYISWSPWFALPARSRQAEPARHADAAGRADYFPVKTALRRSTNDRTPSAASALLLSRYFS